MLRGATSAFSLIRLDSDGQPSETSAGAVSILERFFELRNTTSLPSEIVSWLAESGSPTDPAQLVLERPGGRRLVVYRAPTLTGDVLLLSDQPNRPIDTRTLGLTAREAEVLELVREGLATKRIAAAIGISPRTVDKHVQHALDKLGVRTRVQVIALIDGTARPELAV